MFNQIDLRKLAELSAPDRAFLSLYLSGPAAMAALDKRIRTDRSLLKDHRDELEYFDQNMKMLEDYFNKSPHKSGEPMFIRLLGTRFLRGPHSACCCARPALGPLVTLHQATG